MFKIIVIQIFCKKANKFNIKIRNKLQALVSKLGGKIERPQSPYKKSEKIQALVKEHVIPFLKDELEIEILNHLIKIEDEVLFSTFDVFESDRDEEELVDTVIRILNKQKQKRQNESNKVNEQAKATVSVEKASVIRQEPPKKEEKEKKAVVEQIPKPQIKQEAVKLPEPIKEEKKAAVINPNPVVSANNANPAKKQLNQPDLGLTEK